MSQSAQRISFEFSLNPLYKTKLNQYHLDFLETASCPAYDYDSYSSYSSCNGPSCDEYSDYHTDDYEEYKPEEPDQTTTLAPVDSESDSNYSFFNASDSSVFHERASSIIP